MSEAKAIGERVRDALLAIVEEKTADPHARIEAAKFLVTNLYMFESAEEREKKAKQRPK